MRIWLLTLGILAATPSVAQADDGPGLLSALGPTQTIALVAFLATALLIAGVFIAIIRSTRNSVPKIDVNAAYKIRKVFFFSASAVVVVMLALTLSRTPYPDGPVTADRVVYVAAHQFSFQYSAEPIASIQEIGKIPVISALEVPANALIEFRVTSLDVNHDFAIYGPDGIMRAQTQAMPGYTNVLRVRLTEPGAYNVFCLEYCGAAHHGMRSMFTVR